MLLLVVMGWMLHGIGALWRRFVWERVGASVDAVAHRVHGRIKPVWGGWRVVAPGVRVTWRGGLAGERTRVVQRGGKTWRAAGFESARAVMGVLEGFGVAVAEE